jgi:hypothetical protein
MANPYNTKSAHHAAREQKERVDQEILALEAFKESDSWHKLEDMEQIRLERQHNAWAALANVLEDRIRQF